MKVVAIILIVFILFGPKLTFAVSTKPPYKTIKLPSKNIKANIDMILAVLGGDFTADELQLVNNDKANVVKATKVISVKLGPEEVLQVDVQYSKLCGASGNCPSGIVKKSLDKYMRLLSGGNNGVRYLTTIHNGMNDVITFTHAGGYETGCTVYEYDGTKYSANERRTVWEVQDKNRKHTYYLNDTEYDEYQRSRY